MQQALFLLISPIFDDTFSKAEDVFQFDLLVPCIEKHIQIVELLLGIVPLIIELRTNFGKHQELGMMKD